MSSRIRARVSQSTQSVCCRVARRLARARAHHGAQRISDLLARHQLHRLPSSLRTHRHAHTAGPSDEVGSASSPLSSQTPIRSVPPASGAEHRPARHNPGRRRRGERRRGRWRRGRRRHHRECGRPDMTGRWGGHSIVGRPPGKQHTGRETGERRGAVCCLLCCAVRPSYQHKPMPSVVTAHVWSWAHEIVAQVYPVGTVVRSTLVDKPDGAPAHRLSECCDSAGVVASGRDDHPLMWCEVGPVGTFNRLWSGRPQHWPRTGRRHHAARVPASRTDRRPREARRDSTLAISCGPPTERFPVHGHPASVRPIRH